MFQDDPWTSAEVDRNAVFCGMQVTIDGTPCPRIPFVSEQATAYPELGCRIEVRQSQDLKPYHHSWKRGQYYGANALISFHGQVVALDYCPVGEPYKHFGATPA